jgi:hypothetical protein
MQNYKTAVQEKQEDREVWEGSLSSTADSKEVPSFMPTLKLPPVQQCPERWHICAEDSEDRSEGGSLGPAEA